MAVFPQPYLHIVTPLLGNELHASAHIIQGGKILINIIWVVTGVVIRFLHDGVLQKKKDKSWCLEKVNYDCDQSPLLHTIVVCKSGL